MGMDTSEILFTRQRHEADRAGLHYDIRLVHGDVAYSWATKLDMPKPGESIILHQQPIHDAAYALSKKVVIPKGQYGGGTTYLDFVRKANLKKSEDGSYFTLTTKDGKEKYLLKHIPSYGEGQWLFKNLTGIGHHKEVLEALKQAKKNKGMEKKAILLTLWQNDETQEKKWFKDLSQPIGPGWRRTSASLYKHKKEATKLLPKKEGLVKKAKEIVSKKEKKQEPQDKDHPHTLRALEKLEKNKGLLVDHSMGSGKTRLYLRAMELHQKKHPNDNLLFIAPASLTSNVYKELKKHNIKLDTSKLETLSYEKAAIDADRLKKKVYGMVVADEAHKLRNTDTKRHQELSEVIVHAKKRLLGTGTAAYNHPSDVAPLVNLAAGEKVLPEGKAEFEKRYIEKSLEQPPLLKRILGHPPKEIQKLKNKKELEKILRKNIDHYDLQDDPKAQEHFPKKNEVIKEVEMSPEQHSLYKYLEGKLPWHLRLKVRMNMPLDKKDVSALQAFSTGIRQASNSVRSFMPNYEKSTPKMEVAANSLVEKANKDKNFRGLVYSNYLGSGLEDYSRELKKRGVPHAIYHGGLNKKQKDELVDQYNAGKVPVLLLSSSGAEGLNTKGTKLVQVLEPHYNKSKIDQVVARAVRFKSHEHLPAKERVVEVEHYHSVLPKGRWGIGPKQYSIDEYMHHNSKTKGELGDQMKELVKESSVLSNLMIKCEDLIDDLYMAKIAQVTLVPHRYERAKYKEMSTWDHIVDPVGSLKRDGAAFFMEIQKDGSPRFYSRRESVKGGFPDRTDRLMHLPDVKVPQFAGNVYHVELVHTGHDYHDTSPDSHPTLSGILNSNPDRALNTQKEIGPVRAILLDVIKPDVPTFGEKLQHLQSVKDAFGDVPNLHMPNIKIGRDEIAALARQTKQQGHEGIVVTSLTTPEDKNIRIKVKHVDTYNLRVVDIIQEVDKFGNPKESMGALAVIDATGRVVAKVGTGFTKAMRKEIWDHKEQWLGKLIQVKAMPTTASRLRAPVFNGLGDGDLDTISERFAR